MVLPRYLSQQAGHWGFWVGQAPPRETPTVHRGSEFYIPLPIEGGVVEHKAQAQQMVSICSHGAQSCQTPDLF